MTGVSSDDNLVTKWPKFEDRYRGLRAWLKQNHPEVFADQKHCDEGASERAYWHYGYMAAINDLVRAMTGKEIL